MRSAGREPGLPGKRWEAVRSPCCSESLEQRERLKTLRRLGLKAFSLDEFGRPGRTITLLSVEDFSFYTFSRIVAHATSRTSS